MRKRETYVFARSLLLFVVTGIGFLIIRTEAARLHACAVLKIQEHKRENLDGHYDKRQKEKVRRELQVHW